GRAAAHAIVLAFTRRGRGRHVGLGGTRAGLGDRLGPGLAGLDRNDLVELVLDPFGFARGLLLGGAAFGFLALGLAAGVDLGVAPCVLFGLEAVFLCTGGCLAQGTLAGLVLVLGQARRICRVLARADRASTRTAAAGLGPATAALSATLALLGRTRAGRADAPRALFNNHRA